VKTYPRFILIEKLALKMLNGANNTHLLPNKSPALPVTMGNCGYEKALVKTTHGFGEKGYPNC